MGDKNEWRGDINFTNSLNLSCHLDLLSIISMLTDFKNFTINFNSEFRQLPTDLLLGSTGCLLGLSIFFLPKGKLIRPNTQISVGPKSITQADVSLYQSRWAQTLVLISLISAISILELNYSMPNIFHTLNSF